MLLDSKRGTLLDLCRVDVVPTRLCADEGSVPFEAPQEREGGTVLTL